MHCYNNKHKFGKKEQIIYRSLDNFNMKLRSFLRRLTIHIFSDVIENWNLKCRKFLTERI